MSGMARTSLLSSLVDISASRATSAMPGSSIRLWVLSFWRSASGQSSMMVAILLFIVILYD